MEDIVLTSSSGAELTLTSQPDVSIQLGDIGGPIGPQGPTGQQGPAGPQGVPGPSGPSGTIHSVVAGTNITVDNTDPANPKISTTGTTSPLTAKGDVYTFSTTNDRLPVGTDGQILTADSTKTTGLKWAAAPVSGVTSVSVASANGIAGTVTNPTTTPAITLNTTVTGLLKGNGTAISAATATDIPNIAESQVTNLTTDLAAKAPLASPTFTGTPAAPTPATTDNSTTLATTAFVKTLAGTSSIVDNETPAGTVNGTNKVFTLASTPATNSLNVYKNGIRLKPTSDYTLSGSTITFVTAPASGAVLLADYNISNSAYSVGTNSIITDEVPTGTVNGTNTSFTAARAYIAGSLQVFINGVKQSRTTHFTETTPASGVFTMSDAPLTGDNIVINYQYNLNPSSNADTVDGYHGDDLMPVGSIIDYAGTTTPSGNWLFAFGQAVSRTTYVVLFSRLGTTYGAGDGSTTFNLPDLRGRVTAAPDNMGGTAANRLNNAATGGITATAPGATGGEQSHVQTTSELASHNHGAASGGTFLAGGSGAAANLTTGGGSFVTSGTANSGNSSPANITQPTIALNKIIKVA